MSKVEKTLLGLWTLGVFGVLAIAIIFHGDSRGSVWAYAFLAVIFLPFYFVARSGLKSFKKRPLQSERWHRCFPAETERIERFLQIIDKAFDLPRSCKRKVGPDDRIADLYRASAGPELPGTLKKEMFGNLVRDIKRTFGIQVDMTFDFENSTFGQLFEFILETVPEIRTARLDKVED